MGRRVNKLVKFLSNVAHIFVNFAANRTNLKKWRLGSATCVPNFVENGAQKLELYVILCLVQRRKIRRKFAKFQGLVSQEQLGLLLSNLMCKVLYMKALKYVELVEIGIIVFELFKAEIGYLTGRVDNTLVCMRIFFFAISWLLTHYCVLILHNYTDH